MIECLFDDLLDWNNWCDRCSIRSLAVRPTLLLHASFTHCASWPAGSSGGGCSRRWTWWRWARTTRRQGGPGGCVLHSYNFVE